MWRSHPSAEEGSWKTRLEFLQLRDALHYDAELLEWLVNPPRCTEDDDDVPCADGNGRLLVTVLW